MAKESNLEGILRQGIEAARSGDKITARRLLQQVLLTDRDNETALMWMASVVETVGERRQYLERVLRVNPNNQRASDALARLGGSVPKPAGVNDADTPRRAAPTLQDYVPRPPENRGQRSNLGTILLGVIVVAGLVLIGVATVLANLPPSTPPVDSIAATFTAVALTGEALTPNAPAAQLPPPTLAPNVTPSETPFYGVLVTLDPSQRTLPPTFTPTPTFTPSLTPTPTETPVPLNSYRLLYTEYVGEAPVPALFTGRADGSDIQPLGGGEGYSEIAIAPDGRQIAFVRGPVAPAAPVTTGPEATAEAEGQDTSAPTPSVPSAQLPQVYLASLDDVNGTSRPITQMTGTRVAWPAWSPDGTQLAFASNQDGDFDLFIVSAGGSDLRQITSNTALDTAPVWSPDGTALLYTSDVDSPGFTEIYRLEIETGAITRLTDRAGSSYAPAWSPDGTRIAYVNNAGGDGDIFVMDADGQRPFLLTLDDGGAEDAAPVWLPDGRMIAFLSNRGGGTSFQPFVVDLNGVLQPAFTTQGSLDSIRFFASGQ